MKKVIVIAIAAIVFSAVSAQAEVDWKVEAKHIKSDIAKENGPRAEIYDWLKGRYAKAIVELDFGKDPKFAAVNDKVVACSADKFMISLDEISEADLIDNGIEGFAVEMNNAAADACGREYIQEYIAAMSINP